ncbi:autotransporter outer membrane beta-barrel domain-containing protein [Spongiibacter sp.]|uniref:autotransporter outer membrane beta-barrel domain-containing protein n=1 Tax=Spongiibacter sp. TaxID=2024860 RepID=UPI003566587D
MFKLEKYQARWCSRTTACLLICVAAVPLAHSGCESGPSDPGQGGGANCTAQVGESSATATQEFLSRLSGQIGQARRGRQYALPNSLKDAQYRERGGAAGAAEGGDFAEIGRAAVFSSYDYADSERDSSAVAAGFEQETHSAMLGVDYRIDPSFFAGASLSYINSETRLDKTADGNDMDSLVLGVHASKYWHNDFFAELLVTLGDIELDSDRSDFSSRYQAATDGDFVSGEVSLGYGHSDGRWRLTPLIRLLSMRGELDAYTESDSSGVGAPRSVETQYIDSLMADLSLQVDYVILTDWGVLIPSYRMNYRSELADANAVTYTAGGITTTETPDDPDDQVYVVNAGVSAQLPRGLSLFSSYEQLLGHAFMERRSAVVGFRYELP